MTSSVWSPYYGHIQYNNNNNVDLIKQELFKATVQCYHNKMPTSDGDIIIF